MSVFDFLIANAELFAVAALVFAAITAVVFLLDCLAWRRGAAERQLAEQVRRARVARGWESDDV